jgi:hypothetical protein
MHSSPRPLFDAFIFAQLRSAASIQTRMSSISEVPAELAIKSQSLEANKKPGVQYALTPDGVELPIVDVTHPIFALSLTPAEQQERMQAFVRETQKLEQLAPPNWRRRRAPSRLAGFHHVGSKGRLESGTRCRTSLQRPIHSGVMGIRIGIMGPEIDHAIGLAGDE